MEVLAINEAKECTGGIKIGIGLSVIGGALISFALGVFNGLFSSKCVK